MDTIDVIVLVFPDGSTYWQEQTANFTMATAQKLAMAWREQLPADHRARMHDGKCMGGAVHCRMLREDYDAIPATNRSAALAASLGGP